MQRFVLNDVCCPASVQDGAPCHGRLEPDQSHAGIACAPADADEIVEGILRCEQCGAEYPVLCGLSILVDKPWLYLRDNYRTILSLAAEAGLLISQSMIALLQAHQVNVGPLGKGEDKYNTPSVLSRYLCQHYDNVWDVLPPDHPIRSIVRDYYHQDFYTTAFELPAPYLNSDQRALDVGCGVGRSVYELACHCGLVYGVEPAFGSAFVARRVLRHFPDRLNDYWLKWDGDIRQRRPLPDRRRDNAEIVVAFGDKLPFPTAAFDVVNSWNVVDRVPNPERLLADQDRVLRPGGILSLADPYTWETKYTSHERWIGGRDGVRSIDAIRERVQRSCDILQEQEYLPWLSWAYERNFHLFFPHALVARKRPADEE